MEVSESSIRLVLSVRRTQFIPLRRSASHTNRSAVWPRRLNSVSLSGQCFTADSLCSVFTESSRQIPRFSLKIACVCLCLQHAPNVVESLEIQGFSDFPAIRPVILRNRGLQVR